MAQFQQEQQKHFRTEPLLTMAERFEIESKLRQEKYDEYDKVKKQVQSEAKEHDAKMRNKFYASAPLSRLQAGQQREAYRPDLRGVDTETARYQFDDDNGDSKRSAASDRERRGDQGDQEKTPADREREQREQREKEQREQREKEEHEQRSRPTANAPPPPVVMRRPPAPPPKPPQRRGR